MFPLWQAARPQFFGGGHTTLELRASNRDRPVGFQIVTSSGSAAVDLTSLTVRAHCERVPARRTAAAMSVPYTTATHGPVEVVVALGLVAHRPARRCPVEAGVVRTGRCRVFDRLLT